MTKKKSRSLHLVAHSYATNRKGKNSPMEWSDSERGTYWWGCYEGYMAGVRTERRRKRK